MKIFPKTTSTQAPAAAENKAPAKEAKITRKKPELPAKKEISSAEIKDKLAAHVTTSDAAKNMAIKNSRPLGANFMDEKAAAAAVVVEAPTLAPIATSEEEIKTPNTKDLTLKSDIAQNDPKDSNTQEKLKAALTRGAFNFNPKEREALEKILAD